MTTNRRKHLLMVFVFFYKLTFPYTRTIDITKEIQFASYYGEIVFKGYDTTKVSKYSKNYHTIATDPQTGKKYIDTNFVDSVWILSQVNLFRLDNKTNFSAAVYTIYSWVYYRSRPDNVPDRFTDNGFWPKIGDTCLIIIDSKGYVSVFGLAQKDKYVFWDPYENSSWNSYFVFDAPFEYHPKKPAEKYLKINKRIAEMYKKQFAGQYHCAIRRKEFWDIFKKAN